MKEEIKSSLCNIFKINATYPSEGKWQNLEIVLKRKKIVWISVQIKWTKQKTSRRTMKSPLYFKIITSFNTVFCRLPFLNYDFRHVIRSEVSPALLMLMLVRAWTKVHPGKTEKVMLVSDSTSTPCLESGPCSCQTQSLLRQIVSTRVSSCDCGATGHDLNLVSLHPFSGTESPDF